MDQYGSGWIRLDQCMCIRLDKVESTWIRSDQYGSGWTSMDQVGSPIRLASVTDQYHSYHSVLSNNGLYSVHAEQYHSSYNACCLM
jgi:hypothetical protein